MLYLSTVNTSGIEDELFAFIEKVDNDGLPLSPRLVWDTTATDFVNIASISPISDAYVAFTEDTYTDGYYYAEIDDIDVDAENLLVKVLQVEGVVATVIGQSISIPGDVTPTVTLSLEVNEDRG